MAQKIQELDSSDFKRVLIVVAHPDDAEYGTSAAVAAWTEAGIEVGYLLATAGEAGMQRSPAEAGPLRRDEQRDACQIVGVDHLTILDFPDGSVMYSLELRAAIAQEIRTFQPDVVVSGSGALEVPWGFDHADHRAVGLATIDAVRDAGNRWMFPEQLVDCVEPWEASTHLITGSAPNRVVTLTEAHVQKAVRSLAAHKAYLADLPWHETPETFIPNMLSGFGKAAGVEYAMGFTLPGA